MFLGTLFIIAAASGTGKTSLAKALATSLSNMVISISHTTRALRVGEQAGVSYFFTDEKEFENMIHTKQFLEYAKVFENYYGTTRKWVVDELQKGQDIILDIDWQGAEKVRQAMPNSAVSIFLLPPSRSILKQRLENRNSDSAETVAKRLSEASSEIAHYKDFDYLIVNDNFDQALLDLQNIVSAHRLRCSRQQIKYAKLLEELMN